MERTYLLNFNAIRHLQTQNALTDQQLIDKICTPRTWARWRAEKSRPFASNVAALAARLKVQPVEIMVTVPANTIRLRFTWEAEIPNAAVNDPNVQALLQSIKATTGLTGAMLAVQVTKGSVIIDVDLDAEDAIKVGQAFNDGLLYLLNIKAVRVIRVGISSPDASNRIIVGSWYLEMERVFSKKSSPSRLRDDAAGMERPQREIEKTRKPDSP